jgi:acyl-CoA synthetase (AMP-forming)/AMP-acid ligase II/NADP-dependent 3-hydroxy acid dehydrogenase YdfG/acyl carrier protein
VTTTADRADELAAGITAAALAVPVVRDAVAVVRHHARVGSAAVASVSAPPVRTTRRPQAPPAEVDGGPVRPPTGAATTLQEALRQAADLAPDKGTRFLTGDGDEDFQSYRQLLVDAQHLLGGLRAAGLRPGDAPLFQFRDNRAFLTAFWACVLGGFVPTPVAVATSYTTANEVNRRLHNAWQLLDRPILLTDTETAPALAGVRALWNEPGVRIHTVAELSVDTQDTEWWQATPDSPVLHLLTSGSTGVPKCVVHTNASVTARTWATIGARELTDDEVTVMWMPLDHVTVPMYNVRDVFLRCSHVNAPMDVAVGDPLRWLDWLDRYGATSTWAPNFAYALVNEQADEIRRRRWDLSRMREFTNGGESVVPAVSHRFLELLAPHGLRADCMVPVWGMSETCSGVTYSRQHRDDRGVGTVVVASSSLGGDLRYVSPDDGEAVSVSSVGAPLPGVRLRIAAPDGTVLPEDRVGELLIRGSTMMRGYRGNEQANRESFDSDGWFHTGDLAFVHDGAVAIVGRTKDQIVVRGVNYLAHELEAVVERVPGVRVSFSAAVGVREPGGGSDRLAIFFVPSTSDGDDAATTSAGVRAALAREVGLAPELVVPVTEAEFPKTNSGKIQRSALAAALGAGRFTDHVDVAAAGGAVSDTWFVRRDWVPLPPVQPAWSPGGPTVVFATAEDAAALEVPDALVFGTSEVRPDDIEDVRRALSSVVATGGPPHTVVFAWPLSAGDTSADDTSAVGHRLMALTSALTTLLRALTGGGFGRPRLLVLTRGAVHVLPGDEVDLGVCAVPGLVRTAVAEAVLPVVRHVDLPADRADWAASVLAELADGAHSGVVAARGGLRWRPALRPVAESEADGASPVVPGGLYLITGGLGGIGHSLAAFLLATYGVTVLLVGRTPATGDHATRLAELADIGDVVHRQLDVADVRALTAATAAAEQHAGRSLDGVFHLAGANPGAQWDDLAAHTLTRETAATFAEMYRAKVSGTMAVAAVLADRPAASLVLFGSVNGEFGGHSFGAYSAANTFLAGFAHHWHHDRGRLVRCVGWSAWTGVGMSRDRDMTVLRQRGFRPISDAAGLRLLLTALVLPHHYLMVGLDLTNPAILAELAPADLRALEIVVAYTAGDGIDPAVVRAALDPVLRDCPVPVRLREMAVLPRNEDGTPDARRLLAIGAARHFSAPTTDLERRIAGIWSDVFGRSRVGRDESFFDLGGSSLQATRLLTRVEDVLDIRLTMQSLYENPTVAGLAAVIHSA